jgi:hypothetical protein
MIWMVHHHRQSQAQGDFLFYPLSYCCGTYQWSHESCTSMHFGARLLTVKTNGVLILMLEQSLKLLKNVESQYPQQLLLRSRCISWHAWMMNFKQCCHLWALVTVVRFFSRTSWQNCISPCSAQEWVDKNVSLKIVAVLRRSLDHHELVSVLCSQTNASFYARHWTFHCKTHWNLSSDSSSKT